MIHYILLPAGERHALRREYRLRLAIIAFFFISCVMVFGIITLMPAYLLSRQQENEAQVRQDALNKTRKENGAEALEKELVLSQAVAQKINSDYSPLVYGDIFQKIISHKKKNLALTLFDVIQETGSSTIATVSVQGMAATRDALLQFKKDLEADKSFTQIDLPLSDLAKGKDIFFNIKFKAVKP